MGSALLKNESHKSFPSMIIPLTGAWFCRLGHANSLGLRLWPCMFPSASRRESLRELSLSWWSQVSASAFFACLVQTLWASALDFKFSFFFFFYLCLPVGVSISGLVVVFQRDPTTNYQSILHSAKSSGCQQSTY